MSIRHECRLHQGGQLYLRGGPCDVRQFPGHPEYGERELPGEEGREPVRLRAERPPGADVLGVAKEPH